MSKKIIHSTSLFLICISIFVFTSAMHRQLTTVFFHQKLPHALLKPAIRAYCTQCSSCNISPAITQVLAEKAKNIRKKFNYAGELNVDKTFWSIGFVASLVFTAGELKFGIPIFGPLGVITTSGMQIANIMEDHKNDKQINELLHDWNNFVATHNIPPQIANSFFARKDLKNK